MTPIKIMARRFGTSLYGEAKPVKLWGEYLVCELKGKNFLPGEERTIYVHNEILREAEEMGFDRLWVA